jgi:hypothetical protein
MSVMGNSAINAHVTCYTAQSSLVAMSHTDISSLNEQIRKISYITNATYVWELLDDGCRRWNVLVYAL